MLTNIQLQVAIPCHENWNKMSSMEQGRFCQSCEKTVTDFSIMTDREILHYLSQKGTNVCGRFANDQLNRSIAININKKFSWKYLWNFVLATFLTTSAANAQSKPSPLKKTSINNNKSTPKGGQTSITVDFNMPGNLVPITGVITDSKTNLPIPFATVYVKGSQSGVAADANGKFTLNVLFGSREMVLVISAVGYKNQEYAITNKTNMVSFYLDPQEQTLGEVVVTAPPLTTVKTTLDCHAITMGMLVARKEVDLNEKIDRRITDLTSGVFKKKELTIYPNPAKAGSIITISLLVKETGNYILEILDAEGRIANRSGIVIQSKFQKLAISTDPAWSKGIYWVRVTKSDSKKIYHGKLVILAD